jgi:hypothetical protein
MSTRLALPCDCVGTCGIALFMEYEQQGDYPQEFFVEFYTAPLAGRNLRSRLKHAWGAIRNREPYAHAVCWTSPEQPERLRDWLIEKLPEAQR